MRRYMLAVVVVGQIIGAGYVHADPSSRIEGLLRRSELSPRHLERVKPSAALPLLPLKDTGDGAETIFCLTFDRRETRRMLRKEGHAYVCFNFLQNPSEAVGNILSKSGRQRCLITGFFAQGETIYDDCLVLAFCGNVYVTGSCS